MNKYKIIKTEFLESKSPEFRIFHVNGNVPITVTTSDGNLYTPIFSTMKQALGGLENIQPEQRVPHIDRTEIEVDINEYRIKELNNEVHELRMSLIYLKGRVRELTNQPNKQYSWSTLYNSDIWGPLLAVMSMGTAFVVLCWILYKLITS